jgi:hypothetical protein
MSFPEQIRKKLTLASLFVLPIILLSGMRAWSQADNPSNIQASGQPDSSPAQLVPAMAGTDHSADPSETADDAVSSDDRMRIPPPVSGQAFSSMLTSEERFNYLRYGMAFTSAYTDNALGPLRGYPVSDVSYSVAPMVALDESTVRTHWLVNYAPGFTAYQHTSELNEVDQNAGITFQWRPSQYVTVEARDGFQKSSNVFNQPDFGLAGTVTGGTQGTNTSVIPPIADRLSNAANADVTYQFGRNSMIGVSSVFSNLHYPDPSEVPGLYDAASQSGSAFYSFRIGNNYVGATYQYQRLVSYPTTGLSETQTQAAFLFYSFYPTTRLSFSVFGGPQYASTAQPAFPTLNLQASTFRTWKPAGGASLSWQGRLSSFAMAYSHSVAGSGGLIEAVRMDSVTAVGRQQLTRTLSASLNAGYAQNNVLGTVQLAGYSGHSIFGTASLQQLFGEHLSVQLGYTRLHQDYSNIAVFSSTPDTNREFISVSYQFSRPLGR